MLAKLSSTLFLGGAFALVASCTSLPGTDSADLPACGDAGRASGLEGSQCVRVAVPLHHDGRSEEEISLFVRTFPALRRSHGEVILLAGGPGESGASFYPEIDFFREAFAHYDLVIPDHRGTGFSTKICEPEETADSADGLNLAGQEWGSCFGQIFGDVERVHAFNLDNAAKDVEAVIDAVGSGKKTFVYGVSYGTALALAVVERTDVALDGVMLDSLTPAPSDDQHDLSHRSHDTDAVGQELLKRCAADADCPLGPDVQATYQNLLARVDAGEGVAGLDQVPGADLRQFFGLLLDVPAGRARIPAIVAAMADDDEKASDLVSLAIKDFEDFVAPFAVYPQAPFSIPLTGVMSGAEFNARRDLTAETVAAEKAALGFSSPLPSLLVNNGIPLYDPARGEVVREENPPILALHGTMDPKTPYGAAMNRVEGLQARGSVAVVTLEDAPHAAYLHAQDCISGPLRTFVRRPYAKLDSVCAPERVVIDWAR